MLRQKRYFIASAAFILFISGCGLKGPLYQQGNENKQHKPPTVVTDEQNKHDKQE